MRTLAEIMAEQPFFAGMEPHVLQSLADHASNAFYERDTYIFKEGEPAANFYILREGKVALETFMNGRGTITVETVETGEVLGWSWLFAPYRWHFSACVVEPTQVIVLDGAHLLERCERDHDFGYDLVKRVTQIVIERLQSTRLQLLDMYHTQA